jgi:hypothetical protein
MPQLQKDIEYLTLEFGMDNDACDDILNACQELGDISAEYFCEEFVFVDEEGMAYERWHDEDHLNIAHFNALHWEQ